MRTIVLSDCHGTPELITNCLDHADYQKGQDRLVFAGDILDIGFRPMKCIEILLENRAELLWGNHDLAPIIGKPISYQNPHDVDVYKKIESLKDNFKVATSIGDILVTHAGLSTRFYNDSDLIYHDCYSGKSSNVLPPAITIALYLNGLDLFNWETEVIWMHDSPLWYRPNSINPPLAGLQQICGHTPPSWIEKSGFISDNFFSVDPYVYKKDGQDNNRFRYAVIEDNIISIIDSEVYVLV